jgi:RimJ/RimL family protein N-acetyltransferase
LLSLQEEFENQRSWREDSEKLTFIVCLNDVYTGRLGSVTSHLDGNGDCDDAIIAGTDDNPTSMIGDINIFLHDSSSGSSTEGVKYLTGELNLMIARQHFRGQGIGQEVLMSFVSYLLEDLNDILREFKRDDIKECHLMSLQAKIDHKNATSLRLFERLGFTKIRDEPNYFGELDLVLDINRAQDMLRRQRDTMKVNIVNYKELEKVDADG